MHGKSTRLIKAVKTAQWLGGRHTAENKDGTHAETGHGPCNEEEVKRIRQWLLDSRQPAAQSLPKMDSKQIIKRHSMLALQSSNDTKEASSQPFSAQSDITNKNNQEQLEFTASKEIPRPSKPRNSKRSSDVILYHPDFADWTTIQPAKDAWSPSREQSRSSDLLQVLDDATAALTRLLSTPFAI